MKFEVKKGIKIGRQYYRPGTWRDDYEPKFVDLNAGSKEAKHYLAIGAIVKAYSNESKESKNGRS